METDIESMVFYYCSINDKGHITDLLISSEKNIESQSCMFLQVENIVWTKILTF